MPIIIFFYFLVDTWKQFTLAFCTLTLCIIIKMLPLQHRTCNHLIPVSCFPCLALLPSSYEMYQPAQFNTLLLFFDVQLMQHFSDCLYLHAAPSPLLARIVALADDRATLGSFVMCMLSILVTLPNTMHINMYKMSLRFTKHAMVHNDLSLTMHGWSWLRISSTFTTFQSFANGDLSSDVKK